MKLILPDGTTFTCPDDPIRVTWLLKEHEINPLEIIVTRNGKLIPEDAVVEGDCEVRVIRVAHGG